MIAETYSPPSGSTPGRLDTAKAPCLSVKSQVSPDFSVPVKIPTFYELNPKSELSLLISNQVLRLKSHQNPTLKVLQPQPSPLRRVPRPSVSLGVFSVSLQRFSRCMCCSRLVKLASKSAASVSTWDSPMGHRWVTDGSPFTMGYPAWETYKKRHRKWP